MSKAGVALGVAIALALPATALGAKPVDKRNAAKECRAERGTDPATREAFSEKYGTNRNKRNAFGKCVSQKTREEAAERRAARSQAAKDCRAERGTDPATQEAFREKYGTNRNKRNAFGKCVSAHAKEIAQQQDSQDMAEIVETKNAAKECDSERGDTPESQAAFQEQYGTNRNKRNAFGKCVSAKARES
jgi:hypothetical protein